MGTMDEDGNAELDCLTEAAAVRRVVPRGVAEVLRSSTRVNEYGPKESGQAVHTPISLACGTHSPES